MYDVGSFITSNRLRFAASLTGFAVVGAAQTATGGVLVVLVTTLLAVTAIYGVAQYATRISRRQLAIRSLGLWVAFLAIAAVHAVGIGTVIGALSVPSSVGHLIVSGLTWATLLGAGSTTAFLGFREYGSPASVERTDEAVLDGDSIQ
ncbi:hypothetical protein OB905_12795 [Halobacteria archaeon AArc-dxtr1]|nr:hypothetical protein [Halobacteria archaeon AArc-dxtr1]